MPSVCQFLSSPSKSFPISFWKAKTLLVIYSVLLCKYGCVTFVCQLCGNCIEPVVSLKSTCVCVCLSAQAGGMKDGGINGDKGSEPKAIKGSEGTPRASSWNPEAIGWSCLGLYIQTHSWTCGLTHSPLANRNIVLYSSFSYNLSVWQSWFSSQPYQELTTFTRLTEIFIAFNSWYLIIFVTSVHFVCHICYALC